MTVAELIAELQKMPPGIHVVVCAKAEPLDFQGAEIVDVANEDFFATGITERMAKCVIHTDQEHPDGCECGDCLKQRIEELEQEQRDNEAIQRNKDEEMQRYVSVLKEKIDSITQ